MAHRSLAPSWLLSICVFVLGYPAIFTLITFTSGQSGMSTAQAVSSLPLMVLFATFLMFFAMGSGTALASFFIGLIIGTLYFVAFAIIEGTASRFSREPKYAAFAGGLLGAVLLALAWVLHGLVAGGRESLEYSMHALSLVIAAGVVLGVVAPAFTAARRYFFAQLDQHP